MDIYSIEDLAADSHNARGGVPSKARIRQAGASAGVGIIATGVAKAGADVITISGHYGGTGASPITSIKNTGIPWEVGLRDAHSALVKRGCADESGSASIGDSKLRAMSSSARFWARKKFGLARDHCSHWECAMARQCHLNTCPVGIATQDEAAHPLYRQAGDGGNLISAGWPRMSANCCAVWERLRSRTSWARWKRLRPATPEEKKVLAGSLDAIADPRQVAGPSEDDGSLYRDLNHTLAPGPTRRHRFPISNADRAIGAPLERRDVAAGPHSGN